MRKNTFIQQLGEYFNTYLPDIRRAKQNTISSYADSFAIFFEFVYEMKKIEHTKLSYNDFTQQLFDEYVLWLGNVKRYSSSSINPRFAALASFLKYASRRNMSALSAYSAICNAEIPTVNRMEFPYFTVEEILIILKLPDPKKYLGDRDLVLLSFLYETAARVQEICDVTVKDIRFGRINKVRLVGKGDKAREIPIDNGVAKLLHYHIEQQKRQGIISPQSPLFLSQSHEKMTRACIRSIVAKYVRIAKMRYPDKFQNDNYSPHSFRHSKAVHMAEAGVSIIKIRDFLGHAHSTTTEIYARVGQGAIVKALTERKLPSIPTEIPKERKIACPLPDCIKDNR